MHALLPPVVSPYSMEIVIDGDPMSPREMFNLGTLTCWHKRYHLGDKHSFENPHDFVRDLAGWKKEGLAPFDSLLKRIAKHTLLLPVYLLDHSGLQLSLAPFGGMIGFFDSGQVGYIWATYDSIRHCYGTKRITKKLLTRATDTLKAEIAEYSQYLNGEVYGYEIRNPAGESVASCYGFYDKDACEEAARETLRGLPQLP
jgi:hypothetical protein